MALGQLLIEHDLIDPTRLEEARRHQKRAGGSLIDSLVSLDLVSADELEAFLGQAPTEPESVEETGLSREFLLDFVMKAVYVTGQETIDTIGEFTKLSPMVVNSVFEDAKEKKLLEVLGLADARRYRYALTSEGRRWALDALDQCQYAGPAPVPLKTWQEQVLKQSIMRDYVPQETMARAVEHLVLPDGMVDRLGPAASSGRAILLYGGAGNGKTSIAEAIGGAFTEKIWFPYCVEIDNQIIKVFDTAVHHTVESERGVDERWVRCKRPVIVTGGELTLEMLDLSFDRISKTYEIPTHVKASGGVFIVDDFGRQQVRAQDLLNRWIFPLERRVDFMTLHTGKKIDLFFDQLVIFSTNFAPSELMDEAGLRRIPYKFDIAPPDERIYTEIFRKLCEARHLEVPDSVLAYLLERFYPQTKISMSAAHPAFIVEHVVERCRFEGREPRLDPEYIVEAAQHILVEGTAPPL